MGTEREIDHRLPDLISKGEPLGNWEGPKKWRPDAIFKHKWSRNIPLLWACGALASKAVPKAKKIAIARWYDRYCDEPLMAGEPGSRIYTRWILMPNAVAYYFLLQIGQKKIAEKLRLKVRANWAFLAAAAGWSNTVGEYTGTGWTCTNAGSRSVCCATGKDGARWTRTASGAAKANPLYYQNGSYGLDPVLRVALGAATAVSVRQASWEGRIVNAMVARFGAKAASCGLLPGEQRYLRLVVLNKAKSLDPLKEMLAEWLPEIPFRLMRFEGGTATIAEGWMNSSSTSASHGQTWESATKRAKTLYADDPRFRSRGRRGLGWVSDDRRKAFCVRLQDGKEIHYSHKKHDYVSGPAEINLPPGKCTMDIRITPEGVFDLLAGEGATPSAKPKPKARKASPAKRRKKPSKPPAGRKTSPRKPVADTQHDASDSAIQKPGRPNRKVPVAPKEVTMPESIADSPEETNTDWLKLFLSGELSQRSKEMREEAEQWLDIGSRLLGLLKSGDGLDLGGMLSAAKQIRDLRK